MKRLVLLAAALLVSVPLTASAKMPSFDLDVETRGNSVHVKVRILGDEPLIRSFAPDLNGLLAVLPADQVDEEGRPFLVFVSGRTDVPLSWVEPRTYQGNVALDPGQWAVVPFPDTVGPLRVESAYPKTVMIQIGDSAGVTSSLVALVALATIVLLRALHVRCDT